SVTERLSRVSAGSGVSGEPFFDLKRIKHGAADDEWHKAFAEDVRQDSCSCRDAEAHRSAEAILRSVPDGGRARGRTPRRGSSIGVPLGVPYPGFGRARAARVRAFRFRAAQI